MACPALRPWSVLSGFAPSRATFASRLTRLVADRIIITANRLMFFARFVTVAVLVSFDSFIPRHAPCFILLVRALTCKYYLVSRIEPAINNVADETHSERETARSVSGASN